jgi:peptidoglycan hydrolase-like protein with peptidoglycan-binding domain
MAPPELQRRVIVGAQTLLRRRGFYKGEIDGLYGPALEFSLRAYQSRSGIPPNGHFDMDTLASLGLLPGQEFPVRESPRRRILPRRLDLPPVRGEWVPESREREEDDDN